MIDNPRYQITRASFFDSKLNIEWADGHQSHFHSIWLRHQCDCSAGGTVYHEQRN